MLKDWFSALPIYDRNAANTLSALIEDCQREAMTGLLRWENSSMELFLWTFVNGEGKSLFEYENEKWLGVPRSQWMIKLEGSQANIRKSYMPVQGVRTCEVILTADVEQKKSMKLSGTELLQQVQVWFEQSEPGFIHLQAEGQELFSLIFGSGVSNMEVLLFNGSEAMFSVEQPDDLPIRLGDEYQVKLYIGDKHQDIWIENRLRLAFAALVRMMIQRFGYMVGFVLADRLCGRLTEANLARGLAIKLTSNGIENSQLFHTLQKASESYSFILSSFLEEASLLIGPRISKEIAMNTVAKLSVVQRDLLVSNLRELKGPQFSLASSHRK
jgi:hypothetical protein